MRGKQKNFNRYVVTPRCGPDPLLAVALKAMITVDAHEAVVEPNGVLAFYEHYGDRILTRAFAPGSWERFNELTQLRGQVLPRDHEELQDA